MTSEAAGRTGTAAVRLAALEELELEIDQLVAGGDGLGRFEGIPIFVPRSAPGDRLRVRLVERRPDYGRAEIVEVLAPGSGRRSPPCPYFERCGGCDLQHLEDAAQAPLKVRALIDTLRRLGGIHPVPQVRLRVGAPWGYRLRTQLQVEAGEEAARVGYYARGSHQLVAVESCPILVPELEELLPRLPESLAGQSVRRLDLTAGGDGQVSTAPVVEGLPHGDVLLRLQGMEYLYDARCFFQAHRGLLPALVEEAVGTWGGETAFDLFSGVGLFSLPLARFYRRVVSVEADRVAVRFARRNARRNRVANLDAQAQVLDSWLPALPAGADRVVVDPPRTGLSPRTRRVLLESRPKRLTYVSCHPATLARDLRTLLRGYQLESITALDMFPQTGHLEAVVQLVAVAESVS